MRQGLLFFIIQTMIICTPVALYADPVAHWPLDGNADDISGNNLHGTPHGNPVWASQGRLDGAIELDGVDDYIEIPGYKGITGSASRTCTAWIKTTADDIEILSWGDTGTSELWLILLTSDGKLRLTTHNGYLDSTQVLTDGQWHHIAIVLDDGTLADPTAHMYIDGNLENAVNALAGPVATASTQDVQIGISQIKGWDRYFDGLIDDARIYDYALSQQEIFDLWLPFEDGDGTASNPFQISTPQQLMSIGSNANLLDKHYILTNNIVFNPETNPRHMFTEALIAPFDETAYHTSYNCPSWTCEDYFYDGPEFTGSFDGNGFLIRNLLIIGSDVLGLFGWVGDGGQISNVCLENVDISGTGFGIGGLTGFNEYGILRKCSVEGSVFGDSRVGGLTGMNRSYFSTYLPPEQGILECCSHAEVMGLSGIGGLVGLNGGLVENSYSMGPVYGHNMVGGLAGLTLNGYLYYDGSVLNSFSVGFVAGDTDVGGFAGYSSSSDYLTNNFWDIESSGTTVAYSVGYTPMYSNPGIAEGKTTSEMKTLSTFTDAGWDFSDTDGDPAIWKILPNNYPRLFWERSITYNGLTQLSLRTGESASLQIDIYNVNNETLNWTLSGYEICPWITSVDPNSGCSTGPADTTTISIDIDATGLDTGDYLCELILSADNGDTLFVPASLHVYDLTDFEEFATLAQYWLENDCNQPQPCSIADWYLDGTIDVLDVFLISAYWLQESPEVLHWPLEGNAENSIGNIHHGTVHGDPAWIAQGQINGAVELDGMDDYIEIEDYKGISGGASRTCTAWIRTAQTKGVIFSWGNLDYSGKWIVHVNDDGRLRAEVQGGYIIGTTLINDGQWHHVAAVLANDGSPDIAEAQLYVDGQLETISTYANEPVNTASQQNVVIGACTLDTYTYFEGLIDDVRIYDRPLSADEIEFLTQ